MKSPISKGDQVAVMLERSPAQPGDYVRIQALDGSLHFGIVTKGEGNKLFVKVKEWKD